MLQLTRILSHVEVLFQVRMLKETLPHMRAARKGQVIVVTSLVGFKGFAFTDAYTASKFALEGMFALQEAPRLCQFSQTCWSRRSDVNASQRMPVSNACLVQPALHLETYNEHSKVHLSCTGRQLLGSPEPCKRTRCLCAGLCESLAPPLGTFGIALSLVEPGPVSTPFMENIPKNAEKAAAAGEEAKGELDEVT